MAAGTYAGDRAWAERFMPEVRAIVGPRLLVPSELEQDRAEATDLIVLRARDMRIGVRMRRTAYLNQYPFDFTIRRQRDNGARTEMDKIIDGWGDWLFYGVAAPDDTIGRWWLVDLNSWRSQMIRSQGRAGKPVTKKNGDGRTRFTAFNLECFKPGILIAGSHEVMHQGWPKGVTTHAPHYEFDEHPSL
jgi:hypothetical protein